MGPIYQCGCPPATTSLCNKTIELLLWCYYITIKDGKGILQVGLNMIHVFFCFFRPMQQFGISMITSFDKNRAVRCPLLSALTG